RESLRVLHHPSLTLHPGTETTGYSRYLVIIYTSMIHHQGDLMQIFVRIIVLLLSFLFLSTGVSAFSLSSITYTLAEDGNGIVDLQYQLNGTEKLQYDLITKALDMKVIGKKELEKALQREVTVTSLTSESVQLNVIDMAEVNGTTMTTSSFTYVPVESLVDPSLSWIVQRFDINFIPHTSTIMFPDGYQETFTDADSIPTIIHTLASENQGQV
ncbi:MAG: hypothetical protein CVV33_00975, partial [Methanomicrobiales archaeon HGW-Methanomicrobiales-4]